MNENEQLNFELESVKADLETRKEFDNKNNDIIDNLRSKVDNIQKLVDERILHLKAPHKKPEIDFLKSLDEEIKK